MNRSNNPMKRRTAQSSHDPFGFGFDDDTNESSSTSEGKFECNFFGDDYLKSLLGRKKSAKKSLANKILTNNDSDEIQIISDESPDIFVSKKRPANHGTQTQQHHRPSPSINNMDSQESDPKKPKLISPFLVTSNRNNSSSGPLKLKSSASTTPTQNDQENVKKGNNVTALNRPGTEPRKLTTQLASIFKPSDKPPGSSKPEKNYNKVELASQYAAKKQAERDARYGSTPSAKFMDSENTTYEGFRMANGSKEIVNELKCITPQAVKKTDNSSQPSSAEPSQQIEPPQKSKSKTSTSLKDHESLKHFEPHIIEHIESEILSPNVNMSFDAVAGLEQAKKTLKEIVVFPFLRPDLFKGLRAPSKGVLLFGPPGTGKTLIARCVASQAKATFFNVSVSTVMSKWVGEGEKVVRALFEIARLNLPSIIFIDEIDALLSARKDGDHESSRRVKTEFLIQMDGIATNSDERLLVLGATNKPEDIDEAARRRFPKRLYIALPDFEARKGMIQRHMKSNCNVLKDADYEELARLTNGFSGADMFHFAKEAAYGPLRDVINDIEKIAEEKIRPITFDDFNKVLTTVKPTVLQTELDSYLEWDKKFGCHSTNS